MTDDRRRSAIPGVTFASLVRHADERGSLREVWRASWSQDLDPALAGAAEVRFVQANVSTSAPHVLRGLHLHRRQLDQWVILEGHGTIALVDVRPMLGGGPAPHVETHAVDADDRLLIPAGVAHGFLAETALSLLYLVTAEFDGTDELGFAWDDPVAAVPWPPIGTPDGQPILSIRDRSNPSLVELVARLRA